MLVQLVDVVVDCVACGWVVEIIDDHSVLGWEGEGVMVRLLEGLICV